MKYQALGALQSTLDFKKHWLGPNILLSEKAGEHLHLNSQGLAPAAIFALEQLC